MPGLMALIITSMGKPIRQCSRDVWQARWQLASACSRAMVMHARESTSVPSKSKSTRSHGMAVGKSGQLGERAPLEGRVSGQVNSQPLRAGQHPHGGQRIAAELKEVVGP